MKPILIRLFRDMSDLTAPECKSSCRVPHSCCDEMYCEITRQYALDQGIIIKPTDHPTLPFMGPAGCIVEPHLRPICTLHTCSVNSLGFKADDPEWTTRYFTLRDQIMHELAQ